MAARLYSPRLGRFMEPDSVLPNLFNRQDHNAFAYVHKQPDKLQ